MLKKNEKSGIMSPAIKLEVDIMNRNTIIGLSMMYALWESKKQDLLSLISPFVLYCVGTATSKGHIIDIKNICKKMESEFGYKEIHPEVISRVLLRESKNQHQGIVPVITKKNKSFVLSGSLDSHVTSFKEKRLTCKERTELVSRSLATYFNQKAVYNRSNYSEADAESYLLAFFEKQGESVLSSVEDLRQLLRKDNEIDYYIARFILQEKEKDTLIFSHINELIVGYFITTAIYLQPENADITTASFKDVTFYLDTPILLSFLGYKSDPENESAQAMVASLKKSGAKLACFDYNVLEIHNILVAYRQCNFFNSYNSSGFTLEAFDKKGYTATNVDLEIRNFEERLKKSDIIPISFEVALHGTNIETGVLDDDRIRELILEIKPSYRLSTLPDDLKAINTVSRLRGGRSYSAIEKCKAVFATTNILLVATTKQYLAELGKNDSFPIAITAEELCVMAWMKTFERNNNLPKMRLLENVFAATTPDRDLLEAFYSILKQLEENGVVSADEASLLRIELYAKNELMELTAGNKNRLNVETVIAIKDKLINRMKQSSYSDGRAAGISEATAKQGIHISDEKTRACERIEIETRKKYESKYVHAENMAIVVSWITAILLMIGTIVFAILTNPSIWWILFALAVTAVPTTQAILVLVKKDNWLRKKMRKTVSEKELQEIDKRKEEAMALLSAVEPKQ